MRVKFKCSLFGKTLCLWHRLYFLFLFLSYFFSVFFILSMNCTRYSIAAYFELFGSKWRNVRFRSELNWNENLTFLIHFNPMFHFYTPWKRQKTKGYLTFSGGMKNGTLGDNMFVFHGKFCLFYFSSMTHHLLKLINEEK